MLMSLWDWVAAQVNGAANVSVIEAAKAAGVERFVFISAYIPNIPGIGEPAHP